jgi:predicted GTPase
MSFGAGTVAARQAGARPVDPRPWAVGSIAEAYRRYPQIGPCRHPIRRATYELEHVSGPTLAEALGPLIAPLRGQ